MTTILFISTLYISKSGKSKCDYEILEYENTSAEGRPQEGDVICLPELATDICKKVRADPDNPRFKVEKVMFTYRPSIKAETITIRVLSEDFYRRLPGD